MTEPVDLAVAMTEVAAEVVEIQPVESLESAEKWKSVYSQAYNYRESE